MRRLRQFFLLLLQPMRAHALRDYNYPIARAALAHAGEKWWCSAWDRENGKCSSYAQGHEDLAVYEQFFASAKRPMAPGVFVEMGALNGVTLSNTLAFERSQNWTGVLIEANPDLCEGLRAHRGRASTTLCTGVSGDFRTVWFERGIYTATFAASEVVVDARKSGVRASSVVRRRGRPIGVASAPLGYLLRSVGVKYIDFFSLDVEGSEALVLATMDWTIPVRVWCIEWEAKVAPASTNQSIAELMTRNGYERRRWEHEDDGDKPLTPNQLWVRTAPWEPATYSWRPWVRDDVLAKE